MSLELKHLAACAETHTEPDPDKFGDPLLKLLAKALANAMQIELAARQHLELVRKNIAETYAAKVQSDA